MISESGYVCIVAVKDSFSWNINQHPVNAWKYYRVDTCDFNEGYRNEFINLPVEDIAFPRSVNGLKKFRDSASIYRKGTPMHIKGGLIYNHMINEKVLTHKYPAIQEGDKIKFIQLRQPNIFGANVISFITKVPKELDIHKYIDYDTQYEKAFVEPLTFITDNIGWTIDRSYGTQTTLEDFFS